MNNPPNALDYKPYTMPMEGIHQPDWRDARITALEAENAHLREAMRYIYPYLEWTISPESPGHHPTMPSAVAAFKGVMEETNHDIRNTAKAMRKS